MLNPSIIKGRLKICDRAGNQLFYNVRKLAQRSYSPAYKMAAFLPNRSNLLSWEEKAHVHGVHHYSQEFDDLSRRKMDFSTFITNPRFPRMFFRLRMSSLARCKVLFIMSMSFK